jgi:hypothetical protein
LDVLLDALSIRAAHRDPFDRSQGFGGLAVATCGLESW